MSAITAGASAISLPSVSTALGGSGNPLGDLFGGLQSNYQAQIAPIQNPVTPDQLQNSYNQTGSALTGQQQLASLLSGQNGMQNQQNVFSQQQQLANALQNQANGVGPNPAMAQLANQTGNNMAGQAALMAGQRGAGANVGLIARQIGQQGGAIQQQAAGQGAAMQAGQQLAAQQQLMGQQQAMQGVAGNQISNQMAGQNAYTSGALQNSSNILGAQGNFNNALTGTYGNVNNVNSGTASANAGVYGQLLGGAMQGAGSAASMAAMYKGGQVDAMVSPGEVYVPPNKVDQVVSGKEPLAEAGKMIPGKAQKKGDHLENDTVPAKLEEGGIVIPKSIMESDDPMKEAKKFLAEAIRKYKGGAVEKEQSDFHAALKRASAARGSK